MKRKFQFIAIALLIASSFNLVAQKDWTSSLEKDLYEINWVMQANEGTVLVGGDKAMAGLDPISGEVKWVNKNLKAVEMSSVSMVEKLPFFMAKTQNLLGKESLQIINAVNGETVLNSSKEDISVMDYSLLERDNAILFQVKKDGRYEIVWYDLGSTSALWSVDIDKAKGGIKGLVKGKTSFLKVSPVMMSEKQMVVVYKKSIFSINTETGNKAWSKEYDKDIDVIISNDVGEKLYVGTEKKLDVLGLDGNSQVSEMIKLRNKLVDIKQTREGIFVMHGSGFNILDPNTNSMKWEKPDKVGRCDQVIPVSNGYVSVEKSEENGKIYMMGTDGKKKWDKGISGDVVYVGAVNNGILYVTTDKSNILDFAKGDKVNDKDVKIKGVPAVAFDEENNSVVIFSDKTLSTFELDKGTSKVLAEDIKFEKFNEKEDWVKVDVREDGYFISSSQNNALVTKAGKLLYNNHYKPVSSSKAFGALTSIGGNVMGVDVAGAMQDLNSLDRLMAGSLQDASADGAETRTKNLASVSAGNSPLIGVSNTRYMATKENKDHVYVFMKKDKNKQVVKVNKDTGKTENAVTMKSKSPIYIIDEYEQTIINVVDGKSVECHDVSTK